MRDKATGRGGRRRRREQDLGDFGIHALVPRLSLIGVSVNSPSRDSARFPTLHQSLVGLRAVCRELFGAWWVVCRRLSTKMDELFARVIFVFFFWSRRAMAAWQGTYVAFCERFSCQKRDTCDSRTTCYGCSSSSTDLTA